MLRPHATELSMPAFDRNTMSALVRAVCLLLAFVLSGCRSTVPIHVWNAAEVETPTNAKVALAPLAGDRTLAARVEQQLLLQRPAAKADVALFTAEQLAMRSPIRLASTASLSSDLTALKAAEAVGAEVLLQGEILDADLKQREDSDVPEITNMNQRFFSLDQDEDQFNESLLISWRVIEVETGKTLGTHILTLRTEDAELQYPDLANAFTDRTEMLVAASAREAWKTLAPVVVKEEVRLSKPFFLPGAFGVRRGIRAAKAGQWEQAEERWERVTRWFPFNAAAQHNLAMAYAAREDFAASKQQLLKAKGPFAWRLPGETLLWLDKRHRSYNSAHGIPRPIDGWAFPDHPTESIALEAPPVSIDELPWWTAIPFAKPPGWTWEGWLRQANPFN
ncbi:MAG: hypothetical protein AAGG44_03950 [Planctomycetota bacterium]